MTHEEHLISNRGLSKLLQRVHLLLTWSQYEDFLRIVGQSRYRGAVQIKRFDRSSNCTAREIPVKLVHDFRQDAAALFRAMGFLRNEAKDIALVIDTVQPTLFGLGGSEGPQIVLISVAHEVWRLDQLRQIE